MDIGQIVREITVKVTSSPELKEQEQDQEPNQLLLSELCHSMYLKLMFYVNHISVRKKSNWAILHTLQ